MKIVVVIPYFYPIIGGGENYAFQISRGLKEKYKWDVIIITSNHLGNKYTIEKVKGMKVYRLPIWFRLSHTPFNPFWIFYINRILKKENPDLINGHAPLPYMADIASIVAFFRRIPFILTYQNDTEKNSKLLTLILKIYYITLGRIPLITSDKIIATLKFYADDSPYLKKSLNKIEIIPPGIDLSRFNLIVPQKVTNINQHDKNILFVAQLDKTHAHKGLDYLLESLVLIKKQIHNAKLIVVGKGNNLNSYKKLAIKLGMESSVVFTGFVPDKKLPDYYKSTDVTVLPSYNNSEGFGMVLIEASACGKPVVGTRIGGIQYVIENNKTGFLVPPRDSLALSNSIIKILNDKRLAEKLGRNGYAKATKLYDWEVQIDKFKKIAETLKNKKNDK